MADKPEPFDIVAINDRGVYGLCAIGVDEEMEREFTAKAQARGHRTAVLPRHEACRRHRDYLATLPEFAKLLPDLQQRRASA